MVDAELAGELADDLDEPAGDHGDHEAEPLEGADQGPGAGGEPNLGADLVEDASAGRPGEDGDALAQRLGEVELPAHRALGDRGDLCLAAGVGREQLDDLLLDQGRVDVHDDEAAPAPGQAGGRPPRCRRPARRPPARARGAARDVRAGDVELDGRDGVAGEPPDAVDVGAVAAIRAVTEATALASRGAPRTTTAARPLRRRALSPVPARTLTRRGRAGRRRADDGLQPLLGARAGARSMASVRWPRTTTCSRSSTSAPTSAMASKRALRHAGTVVPGDRDQQGRVRSGSSGRSLLHGTQRPQRACRESRHATRSRIGPRSYAGPPSPDGEKARADGIQRLGGRRVVTGILGKAPGRGATPAERSISAGSRPPARTSSSSTGCLCAIVVGTTEAVPDVGVLGHDAQRLLLAATADRARDVPGGRAG